MAALLLESSCQKSPGDYLQLGRTQQAANQLAEAKLSFEKALQRDPQLTEAHFELGRLAAKQGQGNEALRHLTLAAGAFPDREDVQALFGEVSLAAYRSSRGTTVFYQNVEQVADRLLKRDPRSFDGLRFKGHLRLMDQNAAEAADWFTKANSVKPYDPRIEGPWMLALEGAKRSDEAERVGREFIKRQPEVPSVYDPLVLLYLRENRPADAGQLLQSKAERISGNPDCWIELAAFHSLRNQSGPMKEALDRLQSLPGGRVRVGDFYLNIGQPDEARKVFEAAINAGEPPVGYQKRLASLLIVQQKFDEAAGIAAKALAAVPEDAELQALQAMARLESGRPEEITRAGAQLATLVEKGTSDAHLPFHLARARRFEGNDTAAEAALNESLKRDPAFAPARLMLADMKLRSGRWAEALEAADKVLAAQPEARPAKLMRAAALVAADRNAEAQNILEKLLRRNPNDLQAQEQLAGMAMASGQFKVAQAAFHKLGAMPGGSLAGLRGEIDALLAQKQSAAAIALAMRTAAQQPSQRELQFLSATTQLRGGEARAAAESFARLTAQWPADRAIQVGRAQALWQAGDLVPAREIIARLRTQSPEDPEILLLAADLEGSQGNFAAARPLLEKLAQLRSTDAAILNNAAFAALETNTNLQQALANARRAVQLVPAEAAYADTLGLIYRRLGKREEAERILHGVTLKQPRQPLYAYHYAELLAELGRVAEARQQLQQASPQASGALKQRMQDLLLRLP
jgi:predicted Zn-dependent protease